MLASHIIENFGSGKAVSISFTHLDDFKSYYKKYSEHFMRLEKLPISLAL